jgi:hypothetical protein
MREIVPASILRDARCSGSDEVRRLEFYLSDPIGFAESVRWTHFHCACRNGSA